MFPHEQVSESPTLKPNSPTQTDARNIFLECSLSLSLGWMKSSINEISLWLECSCSRFTMGDCVALDETAIKSCLPKLIRFKEDAKSVAVGRHSHIPPHRPKSFETTRRRNWCVSARQMRTQIRIRIEEKVATVTEQLAHSGSSSSIRRQHTLQKTSIFD